MSKYKYCGNCIHFKYEDVNGCGICDVYEVKAETNESGCNAHTLLSEYNNGWTEITPDNVDELYNINEDLLMIAFKLGDKLYYQHKSLMRATLNTLAKSEGYYYYVLPELKIE